MYLWNIFKTLIYLEFCFKRCLSEPNEEAPPANIIGVEVNINSSKATNTYDYDKSNGIKTFTAKAGFGFSTVKVGGSCCKAVNTVWEASDETEFAKEVSRFNHKFGVLEVIVSLFNGKRYKFMCFDSCCKKNSFKCYKHDLSDLYPVICNIQLNVSNSAYIPIVKDGFREYIPREGFAFRKVIDWIGDCWRPKKVIWETRKKDEYAIRVVRDGAKYLNNNFGTTRNITIFHLNGQVTNLKKVKRKWIMKQWNLAATATGSVNSIGVQVNINLSKSTYSYVCTKNFLMKTFTPRENYGISEVNYRSSSCRSPEKIIWEANSSKEFAKEVRVFQYLMGPREIIISLFNGEKYRFIQSSFGFFKYDTSMIHPLNLVIGISYRRYAYNTFVLNGFREYIPKEGFIFKGLIEFSDSSFNLNINTKKKTLWATDNPTEYADKIITDKTSMLGSTNNITIFHVNGYITHLSKVNNCWIKQPSKVDVIKSIESTFKEKKPISLPPAPVKRIDMQPKYNALKNGIILDLSKKSKNELFELIRTGNIDTYVPKLNFVFISVKAKTSKSKNSTYITLWDGSERREYSKKVIVNSSLNSSLVVIYLTSGDLIKFYRDSLNPWTSINPNNRLPVVIDVKSTNNHLIYNFSKNEIRRSYFAKPEFIFKEVKYDGFNVWKAENYSEMSCQVELSSIHVYTTTIKIQSVDGRFRIFYRYSPEVHWTETNHLPRSVASFPNPPKKPYFEPNDYPTDTFPTNYTLDHTAFGINKMHDISDFMLSRPIDHINGYKDIGINGFGMKMVDILMWTDNTVYRRLSANIPLLGRPLFSLIHRNNRWNCGFCKDVKSLQTRLKFTNI